MADKKHRESLRAAYILFVDIVGFSKLKMNEQLSFINTLERLVLSCSEVQSRTRIKDYLFIPTGDGFALAFLDSPEAPLLTALELAKKVKQHSIPCRMGLNIGPVYLREDINKQKNLIGGGINLAQRIMDFGDEGHILASKEIRDWLCQVKEEYASLFHYLGPYKAKHGVIIELYNVFNEEIGNKKAPSRGRIVSGNRRLSGPEDPLLIPQRKILGREKEIEEVVRVLEKGEKLAIVSASQDIINITGSPGIGKTEVCKAALRRWLTERPARVVYYVSLAGANEVSEFIARLSEAYNVVGVKTLDDLLNTIANNPGVLYLDDLEGLLNDEEAVELLKRLRDIPGIQVIASSPERLAGIGRDIFIDALPLDAAVTLFQMEWEKTGMGIIGDSEELRRFIEKDLGCHPLSIILVAAQAPFYPSLKLIVNAWREKGTQLARLFRAKKDRFTSLDTSISSSLDVVKNSPQKHEAILLWGLMVFFPDGMKEEAWQFFREKANISSESLELLIRLNLMSYRYGNLLMLPPLQKFAERKAIQKEDGFDLDALIEVSYPYFLGVAKEAQEHLFDERHLTTLDRLLSEFANIHRFMTIVSENREDLIEKLTAISFLLSNFYQFRAFAGMEILERLISLQRKADLKIPTAHSLEYLGDLERRLGRIDEAEAHYKEAIQLYRQERNNLGLANAIKSLGDLERHLGRIDEAEAHYKEAIQLYRQERDNLGLANAIKSLGDLERHLGRIDEAEAHYKEAIQLYRQERDNLGLANAIKSLGDLERRLGRIDEAEAHYKEAIQLYRQERDNLGLANAIKSLGDLERRLGRIDEAEAHYKEAIQLYRQERDNLGLANAIKSLGDLERHLGRIDEAEAHYKEAIQLYRQERDNLGLANALLSLGDLERHLGRIDEAEAHYKEAIQLYRQERDNLGLANAIKSLGDLERHLGRIDEAEAHYKEAIQLYRQERDNLGLANAIKSLGDLERHLGRIDEAEAHYKEAIQLYRQERDNLGLANAIKSLGDLERHLGRIDEAEAHYKEAIQLYRQERDNLGLANAIKSLGDLERHLGRIDEAEAHYKEAIRLYRQERNNLGLANAIKSLGDLERHLGRIDEAEAHYKEAIQLYRQERDNLGLANALLSLGDLERHLGRIDEAEAHYKEAIQLYRQERDNLGLANAIKSLGDLERHLGRIDEAEAHYKEAIQLYRQERDNLGLANVFQSYGDMYRYQRKFDLAKNMYERAKELYIAECDNMGLAYTCAELARVWHALHNTRKCDEHLEQALAAAKKSNVPAVVKYVNAVVKELKRGPRGERHDILQMP